MTNNTKELTHEQVKTLFDYDPADGVLKWKLKNGLLAKRVRAGCRCSGNIGYRVSVNKKTYAVQHVIWLWMTGEHATSNVLHHNGDTKDNRWDNLFLRQPPEHGTAARYGRSWRCRCDACKLAAKENKRIKQLNGVGSAHGTLRKYLSGCRCEECRIANAENHYKYRQRKGREWVKNVNLKSQFGITLEQYNAMLVAQDGVCAICHKPETTMSKTGFVRGLAVDHDHATGRVRGLLCQHCNQAIGKFHDNVETMQNAIAYLQLHYNNPTGVTNV